jgi:hypothetical protein
VTTGLFTVESYDLIRHALEGKSVYILAPITVLVENADGEKVPVLRGFKSVPVFAYDDTEGKPLSKPDYNPNSLPPPGRCGAGPGHPRHLAPPWPRVCWASDIVEGGAGQPAPPFSRDGCEKARALSFLVRFARNHLLPFFQSGWLWYNPQPLPAIIHNSSLSAD